MAEMDMKEKLVELLDDIQRCGEDFTDYEIYGMRLPDTVSNEDVADHLIASGVTVQECVRGYWDVCNNNGNVQYRCPSCGTVYVYMYKNHIAPDVCKECGARLYLPQPPKGE